MSAEKLYKRIESSGVKGIPRMKLRKEFGAKADKILEELLLKGIAFAEKKGHAITYWSKDNYMQYLLNSDPKFKLIFDMYSNANNTISDTVSKINNDLNTKVQNMTKELNTKVNNDLNTKVQNMTKELNTKVNTLVTEVKATATAPPSPQVSDNGNHNGTKLTLDQFKMEFDRTLIEIPTSIGWVELAMVRERICDKYNMPKQNFYSLASQLLDQFNNSYELSSGGTEGVMVRGLVHGFVRCI